MKILFITHEVSRTGAPMVLLHFLNWLQIHKPEVKVTLLALKGGTMEAEFKASCTTYYNYTDETKDLTHSILKRVLYKLRVCKQRNRRNLFMKKLASKDFDVVYANTIISIPIAVEIKKISSTCKVLAHVHELNAIIKLALPNFTSYTKSIDYFIVPSKLVKNNLITNWAIKNENIQIVYECAKTQDDIPLNEEKNRNNSFVIGASGLVHWRKGQDVFVQLARYLTSNHPECDIKFVWVGKLPYREKIIIEEDVLKLGLKDRITFLGEVFNPSVQYKQFDVFVMTSREDPFPLVCIEVGMLGKPIISFDKAVGTNEILKNSGGFIVPYLDIETMASSVLDYYHNPSLVKSHGEMNKKSFSQFTPDKICPELYRVIQNMEVS